MAKRDPRVERMCLAMRRRDWLPVDWDQTHDGICPHCENVMNGEGDGGESVREQVAWFLACALGEADPNA